MRNFLSFGMHLQNKKSLTNGGLQNHGCQKTKSMEFKVGGRRFYAIDGQSEGAESWQIQDYTSISPKPILNF